MRGISFPIQALEPDLLEEPQWATLSLQVSHLRLFLGEKVLGLGRVSSTFSITRECGIIP